MRPIQWFPSIFNCSLWKFQRWLNGTGCESLHVVITVCPSIWGSPCQCDTRKITASCANSRLPTSLTCHPCYHKSTQIHIHVHARMRRENLTLTATSQQMFSSYTCMIFTYIHVFSFNYPHIDSITGRDAASNKPVPALISLQNINGHCRGAFEINHSTLLLADSRPTYSFFCRYRIILLLLFMNGSASFMPHIP